MAFVTGSLTPDLGNEGDSIGPRDVPRRKPGPSQLAWEAVPEPGAGNRATAAAGGSGTHPGAREAGVTTANPSPSGSSLCSAGASRRTRSTSVAVALTPTELPGRGQRASSRGGVGTTWEAGQATHSGGTAPGLVTCTHAMWGRGGSQPDRGRTGQRQRGRSDAMRRARRSRSVFSFFLKRDSGFTLPRCSRDAPSVSHPSAADRRGSCPRERGGRRQKPRTCPWRPAVRPERRACSSGARPSGGAGASTDTASQFTCTQRWDPAQGNGPGRS